MRLVFRRWWVLAASVSLLQGCAEVVGPPETAPVAITVRTWPGAARPLEDVQLCETGNDASCVLTNVDGEATLHLPFDVETSFTRTKKGFASYVVPAVIPPSGTAYFLFMPTEEYIATKHDNIDSAYPMSGAGTVTFSTFPRRDGATIELIGADGKTFYADLVLDWRLPPVLTETSLTGLAGVAEVNAGDEYRLEFGGTVIGCIPLVKGWPSSENSVRFPVREGFLTEIRVACPD